MTTPNRRWVMTAGINSRIADDAAFARLVVAGIAKFNANDWGTVDSEDWAANDRDAASLSQGEYGRIIAAYGSDLDGDKFWIIWDTEAVTLLFPSEY